MLRTRHCGGIFHFWPKTPGPLISRNFTRDWAAVFPRSSPGIEAPLGAHTSPRRSGVVKGGGCASFGAGGLAAGFGRRKGRLRGGSGRKTEGFGAKRRLRAGKPSGGSGVSGGGRRTAGGKTSGFGRKKAGSSGGRCVFSAAWRGKTAGFRGKRAGLRGGKAGKRRQKPLLRGGFGAKTGANGGFRGRRVTGLRQRTRRSRGRSRKARLRAIRKRRLRRCKCDKKVGKTSGTSPALTFRGGRVMNVSRRGAHPHGKPQGAKKKGASPREKPDLRYRA